jgi:broad specificity phosphatase PhoE
MKSPAEIIDAALFEQMGCRPPGMTKHVVKALADGGYRIAPALTAAVRRQATEAAAYLREEADFNRSWTDGRRRAHATDEAGYVARRLELAEERDRWAAAIEALVAGSDAGGGNG